VEVLDPIAKSYDVLDDEIVSFIIELELFVGGTISNDGIFLKYLSNLIILNKSHNLN
jgi:hypothetical protein